MNEILRIITKSNEKAKLTFDEKNHKYYIDDIELISVTTKKSFYFPFNSEKISRVIAEKNWVTEEDILDEWKMLSEQGSITHSEIDNLIKNKKKHSTNPFAKSALKFLNENKNFEIIGSEIQVYCKIYNIAGTVDLIVRDKETRRIYTIDWKTSKTEISKKDFWSYGEKPFNEIPNNKFYQYSLQLWTYNLILMKEYGINVFDSLIVHLKENSYLIIEPLQMLYEAEVLLSLK